MIFRFSSNGLAHTAKLRDSRQQQRGLTRGCCSMVLLKREARMTERLKYGVTNL